MRVLVRFTTSIATVIFLAVFLGSPLMWANPLPLGAVTGVTPIPCPAGFYPGMSCSTAVVTCPATHAIGVTYGVLTPFDHRSGTIFVHSGGGGLNPFNDGPGSGYVGSYVANNFQVVQVAWTSDWELAEPLGRESIQDAACRPATLMHYIYTNVHGGLSGQGAMCAQGHSGGSGALGYALAWYGASSYLDHVVLTSGPVFSNIAQGCVVPDAPPITVCPKGQFGCVGAPWTNTVTYDSSGVGTWTGDSTCANSSGTRTTALSYANWLDQSIADGTSKPSFYYPQTSLSGWLCSKDANNGAGQAQYFFQNIIKNPSYSVNRVDFCPMVEDIWNGVTTTGLSGFVASSQNMISHCVKRH